MQTLYVQLYISARSKVKAKCESTLLVVVMLTMPMPVFACLFTKIAMPTMYARARRFTKVANARLSMPTKITKILGMS